MKRWLCLLTLILLPMGLLQAAELSAESPLLAPLVTRGELPPMAERLPRIPRRMELGAMGREPGQHGGELRLLMADQRDLRMMTVYGYTRLVVFDTKGELQPDLLENVTVEEGRIFTLTLREGHRWSDGTPFTSEDFRYWWDDVANNKRFFPGGLPPILLPDMHSPVFEVLDTRRVRYSWPVPNPAFLPALAGSQPLYIQMPAHYVRQFNARYADAATLAALVKTHRVKDWVALHEQKSRQYRPENPDIPNLDPWRVRTPPPSQRFVFERNPFFHRVDEHNRQLPYIDRIIINLASASLIPTKTAAGDSDLQARHLSFENYTFLKQGAKRRNYKVHLWQNGEGARLAIYPNLNVKDLQWRSLLRDVRVRRALSLAINRDDINKVIYYGLAKPSANTLIVGSPLYDPTASQAYIQHDPKTANDLLDQAGLEKRDWDGIRLLPDGRRAIVSLETGSENSDEIDSIEMIVENFRAIGIRLLARATQRDLFRRRVLIGDTVLAMWSGLDNGLASPDMEPDALAPSSSLQYQWPRFGQFAESNGTLGDKIDMPEVQALLDLHMAWRRSTSRDERTAIWRQMLDHHAKMVWTIGIVSGSLQPVIAAPNLRNVPEKGFYSFEPGAFFGVHLPDTFWLDNPAPVR